MIEVIKSFFNTWGGIAGGITAILTLIGLFFKPVRKKIVEFITKESGKFEFDKSITDMNQKIDDFIVNSKEDMNLLAEGMGDKLNSIMESIEKINEKVDIVQENSEIGKKANKCVLSNRILNSFDKNKDKESISINERDSLIEHWEIYDKLEDNGQKSKIKDKYDFLLKKRVE